MVALESRSLGVVCFLDEEADSRVAALGIEDPR
jgi:hypothetical protein